MIKRSQSPVSNPSVPEYFTPAKAHKPQRWERLAKQGKHTHNCNAERAPHRWMCVDAMCVLWPRLKCDEHRSRRTAKKKVRAFCANCNGPPRH